MGNVLIRFAGCGWDAIVNERERRRWGMDLTNNFLRCDTMMTMMKLVQSPKFSVRAKGEQWSVLLKNKIFIVFFIFRQSVCWNWLGDARATPHRVYEASVGEVLYVIIIMILMMLLFDAFRHNIYCLSLVICYANGRFPFFSCLLPIVHCRRWRWVPIWRRHKTHAFFDQMDTSICSVERNDNCTHSIPMHVFLILLLSTHVIIALFYKILLRFGGAREMIRSFRQ